MNKLENEAMITSKRTSLINILSLIFLLKSNSKFLQRLIPRKFELAPIRNPVQCNQGLKQLSIAFGFGKTSFLEGVSG